MPPVRIVIVTPALADANNGNWQTARRWARLLGGAYRVRLQAQWAGGDETLMIALHARRSAGAIAAWRASPARRPLVVVLTGTDLYRDIERSAAAQASLASADRLVVLNDLGASALPPGLRAKCRVVLQSCAARPALDKPQTHLRALMVGHLREEKSPQAYFAAVRRLARRADIFLDHAGAALDPDLGAQARALMLECPRYDWLGALPHDEARARIQAAHVLVHTSQMEGGAHVVVEALRSGTPVLASRIDGNVGLLGTDYPGYFPFGDAAALAAMLERARDDPAMLAGLRAHCARRAPLFRPARERCAVRALVRSLLQPGLPEGDDDGPA